MMTTDTLPYSAACERNRGPILEHLRSILADRCQLLEIGSGSGQHAEYFAAALPALCWQSSDRAEALPGLRARLAQAALPNTPAPIELDVRTGPWPAQRFDALYTANTLHIMDWPALEALFAALPAVSSADAKLVIYGPFNRDGQFTSASNAAFDAQLKARCPSMGIRDAAAVDALALRAGFHLTHDLALPANNHLRCWQRDLMGVGRVLK